MSNSIESILLFQIERTSKMARAYSQRAFDEQGIDLTVEQWVLLKIIHEHPGVSQQELAKRSQRDPASITRTLDLLQRKGWVSREPVPGNRRRYQLQLTESGQVFVATQLPLIQEHRRKSIAGFSESELAHFQEMLLRVQTNLG